MEYKSRKQNETSNHMITRHLFNVALMNSAPERIAYLEIMLEQLKKEENYRPSDLSCMLARYKNPDQSLLPKFNEYTKRLGQAHLIQSGSDKKLCGSPALGNNYANIIPEEEKEVCKDCARQFMTI